MKGGGEPGVLELGGGFFLNAEDDVVGAADTDGGVAFANGFEGVLDLEQMAIGREHRDRSVIPRHSAIFLLLNLPIQKSSLL